MPIPISVAAFTQSIGVNVNMNLFDTVYADAPAVAKASQYLGLRVVRNILPNNDPTSLAPYAPLAAQGIKFDFIAAAGGNVSTMAQVNVDLTAFERRYPGAIANVEGPNEPNIWPISYTARARRASCG